MKIKNLFATVLFAFAVAPAVCLAKTPCPKSVISLTLASDEILVDIVDDRKKISALTYFSTDPLHFKHSGKSARNPAGPDKPRTGNRKIA